MATTDPTVCFALSKSLPAWFRFEESCARVGATTPELLAGHGFGKKTAEILDGKATRGFAFGSTTLGFPQSALIRGDAAAVLIVLQAQEDPSIEFGVFVRQARVPIGRTDFLEVVAGMLDRSSPLDRICIADAIRKEVEEETGQIFAPEEFTNLTQWQRLHAKSKSSFRPSDCLSEGSPTTPGGCDECIHFFCVVRTLPLTSILALRGVKGGNAEEHESTLVQIIPLQDALFVCTDVKFLSAFALFSAWRKNVTDGKSVRRAASPALTMMGLTAASGSGKL